MGSVDVDLQPVVVPAHHKDDNYPKFQAVCAQKAHSYSSVHMAGVLQGTRRHQNSATHHTVFHVALHRLSLRALSTHPLYTHRNFVVVVIGKSRLQQLSPSKAFGTVITTRRRSWVELQHISMGYYVLRHHLRNCRRPLRTAALCCHGSCPWIMYCCAKPSFAMVVSGPALMSRTTLAEALLKRSRLHLSL
jgi:hypothetical protein